MQLDYFLSPERTFCGALSTSKKRLLEDVSQFISDDVPALNANEIYQQLLTRERLGSTGIGHGVAIPHCRVSNCSSIVGALVTELLASPRETFSYALEAKLDVGSFAPAIRVKDEGEISLR